ELEGGGARLRIDRRLSRQRANSNGGAPDGQRSPATVAVLNGVVWLGLAGDTLRQPQTGLARPAAQLKAVATGPRDLDLPVAVARHPLAYLRLVPDAARVVA